MDMKVKNESIIDCNYAALLAGCSIPATRMRDCRDQGISRDTCYLAEQNHQAAINAAAQKQAMENAQSLYKSKSTDEVDDLLGDLSSGKNKAPRRD